MARRAGSVVSAVAALLMAAATGAAAAAGPAGSTRLLNVPYLSQTEDLCGGAALAMVLRYWGEHQVYAEDFAALIDRSASGIRTDVLAAEVSRRGWQSFPLNAAREASGDWIGQHVERGRPIVALIEVRPDRYHYVVIVAWTGDQVIVHDPAKAPFQVMSVAEFDRAWAPAGRWALLILPALERPSPPEPPSDPAAISPVSATNTCGPLIQELVERARTGEVSAAETGLLAATQLCSEDPAAWRELAGVRFLQSRWAEAGTFAERAVRLDPSDEQGWNLLATSRFLNDEPDAALEAWNRIGRPRVDLVRIEGVRRTRHTVIGALVDLAPRSLLTAEKHRRAARRLDELPSAVLTTLRYRPIAGDLAEIEAVVVERPTVARGVVPLAAMAARAWLQRELRLDVAAPVGSGELWTVAWRWWEARPRLAFALALPAARGLPGVTTIEGFWERQSYDTSGLDRSGPAAISREPRRRAAFGVADWATSNLRWKAGAALDRWAAHSHVSLDAALDLRLAGDRISLGADTAAWMPIGAGRRFVKGGVSSTWRSTRDPVKPSWSILAGLSATSAAAPFDLWPGADTGHVRTPLLRAHPLLHEGVVTGSVFGRRLAHGTVEYQHPVLTTPGGAIRLAAFADTATAWRRIGGDDRTPVQTDVGAGIRIALPGSGGTMRVDVARGLRDRHVVFSAGWQTPWPAR